MDRKVRITVAALAAASAVIFTAYVLFNRADAGRRILISGNIEANEVRLSFRVPGKILARYVQEGDRVERGQLLARLDPDELEKIKAQADAAFKAQEFARRRAQEDYERAENLFREGAISRQSRDNLRTQFDAASANQENLRAGLELAWARLGFAELTSPINGYITVRSAESGEVVQAGVPVFTAVDLNDIWLTGYVTETALGRVKLGQKAEVTVDTFPGKNYPGEVAFVSPEAEFTPKQIQTPEERVKLVYRVKVRLANPQLELKPGMPAEGEIKE